MNNFWSKYCRNPEFFEYLKPFLKYKFLNFDIAPDGVQYVVQIWAQKNFFVP